MGDDDVEFYVWGCEEFFPLLDLWSVEAARRWLYNENIMAEEDGRQKWPEDIQDYVDFGEYPPVVVKNPVTGKFDIWDGNHRIASALVSGEEYLPIVVGIPAEDFIAVSRL